MFDVYQLIFKTDGSLCARDMNFREGSSPIVMQYTGLKDKGGVEIYEGDIVQPKHYRNSMFGVAPVVFQDGTFGLGIAKPFIQQFTVLRAAMGRSHRAGNDLVVIGNIHQNPELIKESP